LTTRHSAFSLSFVFLLATANLVLWIILLRFVWRIISAQTFPPQTRAGNNFLILLIWALGALSFCILAPPETRYGTSAYAFLFLLFAYSWTACPGQRVASFAATVILLSITAWKSGKLLLAIAPNAFSIIAPERALYTALSSAPQDGRTIYIVNAPGMYSAPKYLAQAWGLKDRIVFINQFTGCSHSGANDWRYVSSSTLLSSQIPDCATYVFSTVPPAITADAIGGWLIRPGIGIYHFPEGHVTSQVGHLSGKITTFGRVLQFKFSNQSDRTILIYDWAANSYKLLNTAHLALAPAAQLNWCCEAAYLKRL
jgi:hypothetical protein